jgi:hypothetical protein
MKIFERLEFGMRPFATLVKAITICFFSLAMLDQTLSLRKNSLAGAFGNYSGFPLSFSP